MFQLWGVKGNILDISGLSHLRSISTFPSMLCALERGPIRNASGIPVLCLPSVCNQWRTPEGDQWQGENWVGALYFSGFLSLARWLLKWHGDQIKKKIRKPSLPNLPSVSGFWYLFYPLFCLDNICIWFSLLNSPQISQFNYVVYFLETGNSFFYKPQNTKVI